MKTLKTSAYVIVLFGLMTLSWQAPEGLTPTIDQAHAEESIEGQSTDDVTGGMTDARQDGILGVAFGMVGFLAVALCVVALLHLCDAVFGTKMIRPHAKLTYSLGFGGLFLFLVVAAYFDSPEAQARRQAAQDASERDGTSEATNHGSPEVAAFSRNSDEYKACSTTSMMHAIGMNACRNGAGVGELERAVWETRKISDRLYDFARHNLLQACYAEQDWPGSVGVPSEGYNRMCVEYVSEQSNNIDALSLLQRDDHPSSSPPGNSLSHLMCESYIGLVQQGLRMCRDGIPMSVVNDMASSIRHQDRRMYAYIVASWRKGCGGNDHIAYQLQSGYWREDCAAFVNGR